MRITRPRLAGAIVAVATFFAGGAVVGAMNGPAEPGPEVEGSTVSAGPGRVLPQSSSTDDRFKAITPCRLVDSRIAGGRFSATEFRNFAAVGTGGVFADQGGRAGGCGIPASATSISLTVTSVTAEGTGFIRVYPAGASEPNATFMNYGTAFNTSGSGPVKLGVTSGNDNFRLRNYGSTTHVVVDVAGYTVPPIWVRATGAGGYVDGSRVSSITRLEVGDYRVAFDTPVTNCSVTASGPATTIGGGDTQVSAARSSVAGAVYVEVRTSSGTSTDDGFTLQVEC